MNLAEFLMARIAEDEAVAQAGDGTLTQYPHDDRDAWRHVDRWSPARVLAECEAKRRIVEAESRWRRTKSSVVASTHKSSDDWVDVTWLDERHWPHEERVLQAEFTERFTEPSPPSDTLKFLALPYADHPDYRDEWRL